MAGVKKSPLGKQVGHYAFLAGVVIAVIAGVFTDLLDPTIIPLLLLVLGLIVGILNISGREITEFLVAGIALMIVAVPSGLTDTIPVYGPYIGKVLLNISTFVTFAVLVVALKAVWQLAEET